MDYGKNTTAQGKALEVLVLEIFNQIKGVRATNDEKQKPINLIVLVYAVLKQFFHQYSLIWLHILLLNVRMSQRKLLIIPIAISF